MSKFYLKDWHGKEKEFTDDKIFVRGENGELIQFTQGEGDKPAVLQEKTITENGEYTADAGFDGLAKVLVEVAGSGGCTYKRGSVFAKGATATITHGLGVVPDLIIVYPQHPDVTLNDGIIFAMSSKDMAVVSRASIVLTKSGSSVTIKSSTTCDLTRNNALDYQAIYAATDTQFTIAPLATGSTSYPFSWTAFANIL